ncbi:MAG: sensor histidine kinase [Anaerolineae bacterium]|nr:sensor histidine kinase [Anaerolineae bacterium]
MYRISRKHPVDEYLVHRILTNLLSNAIKYSTDNTEIQLRLWADGDTAVLEVEDQGIGISLKEQTRLFEQFYKATNAENISGIGLGLSIVRECVERHQGKISVRSEIDRGTTFTVRLPMRAPQPA